jgi:hypothetical protein
MAGKPSQSPSYWGPDLPPPSTPGSPGRVLLIGVRICPLPARREESFLLGPAVRVGDRGRADGATCWAGSSTSANALREGRIGGFRALHPSPFSIARRLKTRITIAMPRNIKLSQG